MQGRAIIGDANFICDLSGFKGKLSDSVVMWDGKRVLKRFSEPRHPQDFVRAVRDDQTVPNARPEAADVFISSPITAADL